MVDTQYIESVFQEIKTLFQNETLDSSNLITLAVRAMELVEKIPNLTGSDKKKIVIQVVKLMVEETDLSKKDKNNLGLIIDTTLPITIDLVIAASRGFLDLNTFKIKMKKLCKCS
jgi:hypothetical protein